PRQISGEQPLLLPQGVLIDFGINPNYAGGKAILSTPPLRTTGVYEILFAPSGAVVGQGTGLGPLLLWVRDNSNATQKSTTLIRGGATLVTVQTRTGFIATHPVANSTTDPYLFARDARSSGMWARRRPLHRRPRITLIEGVAAIFILSIALMDDRNDAE